MAVLMTSGGSINSMSMEKLLSDYAHGDIVKIKEADVPVEFYVAKHDYESGLNGVGRTLLVRKDVHSNFQWSGSQSNNYSGCTIDVKLNDTFLATGVGVTDSYKEILPPNVRDAIGQTTFYYTPKGGSSVTTLSRSVFILSLTELGKSDSYINTEGSALPIASRLVPAYYNGSTTTQWTRSPHKNGTTTAAAVTNTGGIKRDSLSNKFGIRPAFTLPSNSVFNPESNEFIKAV